MKELTLFEYLLTKAKREKHAYEKYQKTIKALDDSRRKNRITYKQWETNCTVAQRLYKIRANDDIVDKTYITIHPAYFNYILHCKNISFVDHYTLEIKQSTVKNRLQGKQFKYRTGNRIYKFKNLAISNTGKYFYIFEVKQKRIRILLDENTFNLDLVEI